MTTNLQRHLLSQYEAALMHLLHGDTDLCLEICLDLRQQPELSFWLRAYVNITLCDFSTFQERPQKVKYAAEALRLALELLEQEDIDTEQREKYARLEARARDSLEAAKIAHEAYLKTFVEHDAQDMTADLEHMGISVGVDDTEEYGENVFKGEGPIEPWELEGKFTLKSSYLGKDEDTEAVEMEEDDLDTQRDRSVEAMEIDEEGLVTLRERPVEAMEVDEESLAIPRGRPVEALEVEDEGLDRERAIGAATITDSEEDIESPMWPANVLRSHQGRRRDTTTAPLPTPSPSQPSRD